VTRLNNNAKKVNLISRNGDVKGRKTGPKIGQTVGQIIAKRRGFGREVCQYE